jgi:hypothetical protein
MAAQNDEKKSRFASSLCLPDPVKITPKAQ